MQIVAEIGLNHDGNPALAYELIRLAKWAGADVAKFQFGWRAAAGELNAITNEQAKLYRRWCDHFEINMLASVFTEEGLLLAKSLDLGSYKIASRTVRDDPDLCKRILDEGKPTHVSLGMWTEKQWPFGPPKNGQLHYIYCVSRYPTAPWELSRLPDRFSADGWYGYSDHCLGIDACILAAARGANYIEKHFTLNKNSQVIRDHTLSATPDELRQLCDVCRPLGRLIRAISLDS